MIGTQHGRLTILELIPGGKHPKVRCRCECGTEKTIQRDNLTRTHSCGCLKREQLSARSITHGQSQSVEYRIWSGMKDRCSRTTRNDFERYGARGITVCERWLDTFENFLADMGTRPSKKHSIDRIDTNGNYEPSNCRWATGTIQRENQRRTKRFTFNGHTGTLKDLARRAGLSYTAVHQRVNTLKWTVEKALTTPLYR